jgi:hypothetical protein
VLGQASTPSVPQPQHVYFDDTTLLMDKNGKPREVRVTVANWVISNGQLIEKFPKQGFLIVELFAGTLTTIIDGKRQQRLDGETWTAPAKSTLSIQADGDTVVFQTVEIRAGRGNE